MNTLLKAILCSLISLTSYGGAPQRSGVKVSSKQRQEITIYDSSCRLIDNKTKDNIFVPTVTLEEWRAFEVNRNPEITISACGPQKPAHLKEYPEYAPPAEGTPLTNITLGMVYVYGTMAQSRVVGTYDHCVLYDHYYDGDGVTTCLLGKDTTTGVWHMAMQDEGNRHPVKCYYMCANIAGTPPPPPSATTGKICSVAGYPAGISLDTQPNCCNAGYHWNVNPTSWSLEQLYNLTFGFFQFWKNSSGLFYKKACN